MEIIEWTLFIWWLGVMIFGALYLLDRDTADINVVIFWPIGLALVIGEEIKKIIGRARNKVRLCIKDD